MKLPAALVMLCASLASYGTQQPRPPQANARKNTVEVFDQRTFDAHKTNAHYMYTLPDGSEIEQWETPGEYYLEETRKGRTNYSTYRLFYFGSNRLMKKGEQFFKFPIGIWRTYNEAGVVTEEVNHERAFKVSVEALEKIMANMNVNISVRDNGVGVLREESPVPTYTVVFPDVPGNGSAIRFVVIDGITGKIVSQMVKQRTK